MNKIDKLARNQGIFMGFGLYIIVGIMLFFQQPIWKIILEIIFHLIGTGTICWQAGNLFLKSIQDKELNGPKKYFCAFGSYTLILIAVTLFFSMLYISMPLSWGGCLTSGGIGNGCQNKILNGMDIFYFSGVTLTTLGYGDIHPEGFVFKMVALTEVFIGLGINVVLISLAISRIKQNPNP